MCRRRSKLSFIPASASRLLADACHHHRSLTDQCRSGAHCIGRDLCTATSSRRISSSSAVCRRSRISVSWPRPARTSYVGTEGYVPPEGPGSAQADIYSLGKVLYELAMGKDRMDFPAVNTQIADLPDKAALLRLNEVLLRACDTNCRKRYTSAEEMYEDLVRLRDGQPLDVQVRRSCKPLFRFCRRPRAARVRRLLCGEAAPLLWQRAHQDRSPPRAFVTMNEKVDQGPVDMWPSPAQFDRLPVGTNTPRTSCLPAYYEPTDVAL